jgi:acyl-coenzyme A thioesterase PaaI-like protein
MTDAILKYDVYQIMQSPDDDDGDGDHECDGENDEYDGCIVVAKIQLGRSADGHPGVVHGGILALLIDDVLGFAYPIVLARNCSSNKNDSGSNSMVSASNTGDDGAGAGAGADVSTAPPDDTGPANDVVAVTANLNVNYASPVPSGSSIRVLVYLTEQTARKLVWKAIVRNKDGNDDEGGGGSDPERKSPSSLLYPPSSSSSFITYCEATSVYVIPRTSCTL